MAQNAGGSTRTAKACICAKSTVFGLHAQRQSLRLSLGNVALCCFHNMVCTILCTCNCIQCTVYMLLYPMCCVADLRALRRVLAPLLEASQLCTVPSLALAVLRCARVASAVGAASITQLLAQSLVRLRDTSSPLLCHVGTWGPSLSSEPSPSAMPRW